MIFPSRRNLVRTVEWKGETAVRKLFDTPDDWARELSVLRRLDGDAAPRLLASVPGILLMEYLPFPTLLDELERQERDGFQITPWLALRDRLIGIHNMTGLLPGDGNLRNFLWDGSRVRGIDFEQYAASSLPDALAQIAAFILEYSPRDTAVKQQAARALFDGSVEAARQALVGRRKKKPQRGADASFVLLAGGKSSRMGRDKAGLPLLGTSLLQLQLDKARLMGIDDILISGAHSAVDGARIVPDIFPDRGPLGGLHACLRTAKHPRCIVLGTDMPLVPVCELRTLLQSHCESGAEITLSVHGERWEPLAGVYSSSLSDRIAPMIDSSGAPVRALLRQSDSRFRQSGLDEAFWINCNTPDDFASLLGG